MPRMLRQKLLAVLCLFCASAESNAKQSDCGAQKCIWVALDGLNSNCETQRGSLRGGKILFWAFPSPFLLSFPSRSRAFTTHCTAIFLLIKVYASI